MSEHFTRIALAQGFAEGVHHRDRYGDEPYVNHCIRVAHAVPADFRVVALLHDVYEDHGIIPSFLTPEETKDLLTLSRRGGETYSAYIVRVSKGSERARAIKMADLRDHLAHSPPPSMQKRYRLALEKLEATAP